MMDTLKVTLRHLGYGWTCPRCATENTEPEMDYSDTVNCSLCDSEFEIDEEASV